MTQIKVMLPTPKTDFGARWCEMMKAVRLGILSTGEMKAVLFNVVESQWKDGWEVEGEEDRRHTERLRTDRYVMPKDEGQRLSPANWYAREYAIIANTSDGKILEQKKEYADEKGMDMTDNEYAWFVYVTAGGDKPGVVVDGIPF